MKRGRVDFLAATSAHPQPVHSVLQAFRGSAKIVFWIIFISFVGVFLFADRSFADFDSVAAALQTVFAA